MTKLSVNLNKVALLRNARGRDYPNVVAFGEAAIKAGADGLTIHPRPDQRHARYDDIEALKKLCQHYNAELNVEGYPSETLISLCLEYHVDQVTLVPDAPDQITSDHGWTVSNYQSQLKPILTTLAEANVRSSLFMDLDVEEIQLAKFIGADRIELHTESYARSVDNHTHQSHIAGFQKAYRCAQTVGLDVNAGHDLDLDNLAFFLNHVPVAEVSIGHALTVEALLNGWTETINRYHHICQQSTSNSRGELQ